MILEQNEFGVSPHRHPTLQLVPYFLLLIRLYGILAMTALNISELNSVVYIALLVRGLPFLPISLS